MSSFTFLCLALILVVPMYALTTESLIDSMYTEVEPLAFVRLLNATGTIGTTSGRDGTFGALVPLDSLAELSSFSSDPPSSELVVVIPPNLVTFEVVSTLDQMTSVKGIVVSYNSSIPIGGFSPVSKYPSQATGLHPTADYQWNPLGNNLRWHEWDTPILTLTEADSQLITSAAYANRIENYAYPRHALHMHLFMHGSVGSSTCLRRFQCLPLGGHSTWTALLATGETVASRTNTPWVLVSATGDADSMFLDSAHGTDAAVSSALALVGAFDVLSRTSGIREHSDAMLVMGVFVGESFGHIGSQRFVEDLTNFTCETASSAENACAHPFRADMTFQHLNTSHLKTILDVGSVGMLQDVGADPTLVIHSEHGGNSNASAVAAELTNLINADYATNNVNASKLQVASSSTPGLPPSPSESFVRANTSQDALMLSDFDTQYLAQGFHSQYDTFHNLDNAVSKICRAATTTARASMHLIGVNPAIVTPDTVTANCSLISELYYCFSQNTSCDYLRTFFTSLGNSSMLPDMYTSVFRFSAGRTSILNSYIYTFFQLRSALLSPTTTCSTSSDCDLVFLNTTTSCVGGYCINSTFGSEVAHLHPAYSPGIEFLKSESKWQMADSPSLTSYSTWTESNWDALSVRLMQIDSVWVDVGFFIMACALTTLTIASIRFSIH